MVNVTDVSGKYTASCYMVKLTTVSFFCSFSKKFIPSISETRNFHCQLLSLPEEGNRIF
jgi:hypothetical protein